MTNDDLKGYFIKEVQAASRSRFAVAVFADMVRAMAISLEAPLVSGERRAELEEEYAQIKGRYTEDEFVHFPVAFALVSMALEKHREDFLGHALESLGASNTRNGQFLTPVTVAQLMSRMICSKPADYAPGQIVKISDDCCGTSVLLIAGAEELVRSGVRQADVLVVAGDIDGRACDCSYIQLSLLGYASVVRHEDALASKRYSPDRYTPGWYLHNMPMRGVRAA